mgnify:CR=1 FL=1
MLDYCLSSVVYLPLHDDRFISIVCLRNSHVLKVFIKIAYSPPSSRYNTLSIDIRARYSLVLCDFGLTTWSFSYVDCRIAECIMSHP